MLSVLFLTKKVESVADFELFFNNLNYLTTKIRLKHALTINDARSWLSLGSYNLICVDDSFDSQEIIPFLLESWSTQGNSVSLFLSKNLASEKIKKLFPLGLEDCSGENCFFKFKALIDKFPLVYDCLTSTHQSVLVLDDLDSPRDIICALIQSLGFSSVRSCSNVDEAISILIKNPLDFFCTVCDINMPNKTGVQFIREVRSRLSLAYLPIVVLTSDPSQENLIKCLKEGITGFLAKPPNKKLLKVELEKSRRIVSLGKDPQLGTTDEIRLLEEIVRKKI